MKGLRLNRFAICFSAGVFVALCLNGWILTHVLRLHQQTLLEQENRQAALQITSEIQQETAALSRMVRAYTTTADTRYLTYYYDIIAIRQGAKAQPEGYGPAYWAEVMAGRRSHNLPEDKPGRSLSERMRTEGFSQGEFAALDRVIAASTTLYEKDQIAFAATQGLYDPKTRTFTDDGMPQLQFANSFVYSTPYLELENSLLQEVEGFSSLTDQRTRLAVQQASARLARSISAAIVILAVTLLFVLIAMSVIRSQVLAPMKALTGVALGFGAGDYGLRADTGCGVRELRSLGQTFNAMAGNIEEDIAQREQIQRQLEVATARAEESTRAKSLFLANMSHEIRTPMNAIMGMAALVLNTGLDLRQQDYIGKIQQAAHSLLRIINDILDFSKIEAGRLELEKVPFQLDDVIGNTVTLLRQIAHGKGLELVLEIGGRALIGERGTFLGDPLRLEQVLTNLLSNAIIFTSAGQVTLRVEDVDGLAAGSGLRFMVEDSGIGMSGEQLERLFQEFSQGDGSTTRRYGGTGLGLSIAKRLLTLMGGEIFVASEPGQGTRFTCTLPLERTMPLESAGHDTDLGRGLRALVVEAHTASRSALENMLALFGMESHGAPSVAAALKRLENSPWYDFLFLAHSEVDSDDAVLIRALKALGSPEKQTYPVILYSSDPEILHSLCEQAGACRFLAKPLLPRELRQLLQDKREAEDADAPAIAPVARDLEGMRVLLVEDNLINQEIAAEMLAACGVMVEISGNGQEALERIMGSPAGQYHAVLMDIQMPVMDGFEAARRIRDHLPAEVLPIIAMTAHAMREEKERCLAVGMNAHIAKPFTMEDLVRILSAYCPKPDQSVETRHT